MKRLCEWVVDVGRSPTWGRWPVSCAGTASGVESATVCASRYHVEWAANFARLGYSSASIRPDARTTSPIGYVRLHGRNYQNWFREKAPRDERYNYLYSLDELDPWLIRIKEVAKHTRETYVITNNHFRGQAIVNAVEIKAALEEEKVPAPEPLFKVYPRLSESAESIESAEKKLFE